jgi:RNA polymerase Rpb2, domain 6
MLVVSKALSVHNQSDSAPPLTSIVSLALTLCLTSMLLLLLCVVLYASQGTNAVVAVISYTGFDMEDAMILNKSSYERGFGHARYYIAFHHALVLLHMCYCSVLLWCSSIV